MGETKNQRLTREITEFCKERLQSSTAKSTTIKSILHVTLVAALAVVFSIGPDSPGKKIGW
jgi:hypothetical protein